MSQQQPDRQPHTLARAIIEVAFIVFLFYANLLMGQYTAGRAPLPIASALRNTITRENFAIAIVSALIGYLVFEYLRRRS